jgi:hypothetical protein
MTNDEEADEIIRRLKTPPTRRVTSIWTLDSLSMIEDLVPMHQSQAIADAIDAEVLKEMKEIYEKTVLYGARAIRGPLFIATCGLE